MPQSAPMKPAGQWHIPVAASHRPPFLHWHGLAQSRPYHPGEHSEGTTDSGLSVQKYENKVQTPRENPAGRRQRALLGAGLCQAGTTRGVLICSVTQSSPKAPRTQPTHIPHGTGMSGWDSLQRGCSRSRAGLTQLAAGTVEAGRADTGPGDRVTLLGCSSTLADLGTALPEGPWQAGCEETRHQGGSGTIPPLSARLFFPPFYF